MKLTHSLTGILLLAFGVRAAPGGVSPVLPRGSDTCQLLDVATRPIYEVGLSVIPSSDVEDYGSVAMSELDARWDMAYFRDVLLADLDLGLDFQWTLLMGSGGVELPNQLLHLNLDAGVTWRYINGTSLQGRLKPGFYTDTGGWSGDAISIPFSVALIQAFNPALAGILGIEIRPSFETKMMPLVGFAWQLADFARLEARLPESRFSLVFNREWSAYAGFEWRNMSYALDENEGLNRERIEFEDYRASAGITYRLAEDIQVTGELGRLFNRSVAFKQAAQGYPESADLDNTLFLRVALGGPF